jgi:hypothetical protein
MRKVALKKVYMGKGVNCANCSNLATELTKRIPEMFFYFQNLKSILNREKNTKI